MTNHPDSAQALFLSGWGQRIKVTGVWRAIKGAAEAAKLKKPVTPHTMRRALATHLVAAGVSVEVVRQLLRHADLDVTACYVGVDRSELHGAVRVLDLRRPVGEDV